MSVNSGYVSGQILYAANLNTAFSQSANLNGDSFTGNVTVPNFTVSETQYVNKLVANTTLSIDSIDVGSGLRNAFATANAAFNAANTSNANLNAILLSNIYNAANAAQNTANNALPLSGGKVTGTITLNSTLNVSNTITGNTEIHGAANTEVYPGQFRAIQGNYGAIMRNDGSSFYLLTTGSVAIGSVGTSSYNTLRPFSFNLNNGQVIIDGTGAGTNFGGNITTTGIQTNTANVATLREKTITFGGYYNLIPEDSGLTIFYNNTYPLIINVDSNLFSGFRIIATQLNTGSVSFRTGSGVIINPRSGTLFQITGQYASASLVCYSTNKFILDGSIQ